MLSKFDFNLARKENRLRKYNPYFPILEKYIQDQIQDNKPRVIFNFETKQIITPQSYHDVNQEKMDSLCLYGLTEHLEQLGYTIMSSGWHKSFTNNKAKLYINFD